MRKLHFVSLKFRLKIMDILCPKMFFFSLNFFGFKKEVCCELRKNCSACARIFIKAKAARYRRFLYSYLTDKRQTDDLLSFYYTFSRLLSLRTFVWLPSSAVIPPRHAAYDTTLAERRAVRWPGAHWSSKKNKPIFTVFFFVALFVVKRVLPCIHSVSGR